MSHFKYCWQPLSSGAVIVCELDYQPADGDGWNEPHTPEGITLESARLNGVDITELLSEDQTAEIEALAMEEKEVKYEPR